MELKFVVGILIVAVGFALMLPLDEKDDTDNAPLQIAQQKTPEKKKIFLCQQEVMQDQWCR
jgi:hypothetical protein